MTSLVAYLLLFTGIAVFFVFFHLVLGRLIRPVKPDPEKLTIYECGEPTIGSSWIQFDLRFYVVALLFVIFDVEVAFFFPWAVVFGKTNALAYEGLEPENRQQLTQALVPGVPDGQSVEAPVATRMSWIALVDILVFFGVLLVGYAYLWRRGDLDWVRSTAAAERTQLGLAPQPPPQVAGRPLAEVGQP